MNDNVKKYEKPEFEVVCSGDPITASCEIVSDDNGSNDDWEPLL